MQLYVGSTNIIWLLGATQTAEDGTSSEFAAGTVTVQIMDLSGANVGSAVTLTYKSGSKTVNGTTYASGNWSGTLGSDAALVAGTQYQAMVVGTVQGNSKPDLTKLLQVVANYDGVD